MKYGNTNFHDGALQNNKLFKPVCSVEFRVDGNVAADCFKTLQGRSILDISKNCPCPVTYLWDAPVPVKVDGEMGPSKQPKQPHPLP